LGTKGKVGPTKVLSQPGLVVEFQRLGGRHLCSSGSELALVIGKFNRRTARRIASG
jgi:hypothetical protein